MNPQGLASLRADEELLSLDAGAAEIGTELRGHVRRGHEDAVLVDEHALVGRRAGAVPIAPPDESADHAGV